MMLLVGWCRVGGCRVGCPLGGCSLSLSLGLPRLTPSLFWRRLFVTNCVIWLGRLGGSRCIPLLVVASRPSLFWVLPSQSPHPHCRWHQAECCWRPTKSCLVHRMPLCGYFLQGLCRETKCQCLRQSMWFFLFFRFRVSQQKTRQSSRFRSSCLPTLSGGSLGARAAAPRRLPHVSCSCWPSRRVSQLVFFARRWCGSRRGHVGNPGVSSLLLPAIVRGCTASVVAGDRVLFRTGLIFTSLS